MDCVFEKFGRKINAAKTTAVPTMSPQNTNNSKQVKKRLRTRVDGAGFESSRSDAKEEKPAIMLK